MRRFLGYAGGVISIFCLVLLFVLLSIIPAQSAVFDIPSGNVTALIAAINKANANGKKNTINLEPGTYTLTSVDNTSGGSNGLPIVSSTLTIRGDQSTIIERDSGAPRFRILAVAANGALTLRGVTLRGGSSPDPVVGAGGAILNEGEVNIHRSTIESNSSDGAVAVL